MPLYPHQPAKPVSALTDAHIHERCDDNDIVRLLCDVDAGRFGDRVEAYMHVTRVVQWRSDHPILDWFRRLRTPAKPKRRRAA